MVEDQEWSKTTFHGVSESEAGIATRRSRTDGGIAQYMHGQFSSINLATGAP
jgi:hypothetical protein